MLMFFASDVVVSKGYQNAPALKFSEKGDFVRFRVGQKVYDPRAEENHRWINITVKSFDPALIDRIRKMGLKEGSCKAKIYISTRFAQAETEGK